MNKNKGYKNFCTIVVLTIAFIIISLIVAIMICIKFKNWGEVIPITISLVALIFSISSVYFNFYFQKQNDYKKFLIAFLEERKSFLLKNLNELYLSMEQGENIEILFNNINNYLTYNPIFSQMFNDYSDKLNKIIGSKDNYLLIVEGLANNAQNLLYKMKRNILQLKANIEVQLNSIIVGLYNGDFNLNKIEEIKGDMEWIN